MPTAEADIQTEHAARNTWRGFAAMQARWARPAAA
jgi:hypothetical protein